VGTASFGSPTVVVDDSAQATGVRPGWPSFFPDGRSVVFQHQSAPGADDLLPAQLPTRAGAMAQIGWTGVSDAAHVTALNGLNGLDATGTSYLPVLPKSSTLDCSADGTSVGCLAEGPNRPA
jgi:hypothetical protein